MGVVSPRKGIVLYIELLFPCLAASKHDQTTSTHRDIPGQLLILVIRAVSVKMPEKDSCAAKPPSYEPDEQVASALPAPPETTGLLSQTVTQTTLNTLPISRTIAPTRQINQQTLSPMPTGILEAASPVPPPNVSVGAVAGVCSAGAVLLVLMGLLYYLLRWHRWWTGETPPNGPGVSRRSNPENSGEDKNERQLKTILKKPSGHAWVSADENDSRCSSAMIIFNQARDALKSAKKVRFITEPAR